MSISIDSAGRVVTGRTNVIVPPENAGVGDLVYKKTSLLTDKAANNDPSNFKVVGRGTADAATVTVDSVGYTLYGGIYSFVNGESMIIAPEEKGGKAWTTLSSSSLGLTHSKNPLMRNGVSHYYSQMNTKVNSENIKGGSSAATTLESAYQSTSLTADTFVSGATDEIKARYGTWTEYIRQTLRVQGVPGTPFGMTATGVKVHEFGRYMGHLAYDAGLDDYPAFKECYNHGEGDGTWWLPSMFELGELMIDEHLDLVTANNNTGWTDVSTSNRWSCVRLSTTTAWSYNGAGMSSDARFSGTFVVRPVTLLRLV